MRQLITFSCEDASLAATLDMAAGTTGLLIVSGGNEVRGGAHRGLAELAQRLAAAGWPVLRFDRRGVGDSSGINQGFAASGPDIMAAAATFRTECPALRRLVGFGICDAATALALFGADAGVDALLLANPWVIEPTSAGDLPPPAAIRARYAGRLLSFDGWKRLLSGQVRFGALARGVGAILRRKPPSDLATRVAAALARFTGPVRIILASGDATAIAFADAWRGRMFDAIRQAMPVETIATKSHSFGRGDDPDRLHDAIASALKALE